MGSRPLSMLEDWDWLPVRPLFNGEAARCVAVIVAKAGPPLGVEPGSSRWPEQQAVTVTAVGFEPTPLRTGA